jgi:branched-chain amino acid transport system substrate-binding protein
LVKAVLGLALCLLLASCDIGRGTCPVVKIGLVAPFEGRYRSLGYEALYAAKLAVRERNAAGGVAGYRVELVALDDGDDADASVLQARKFGVDDQVMGIVGPFSEATIRAAAPVYEHFGLASITPLSCELIASSPGGTVDYRAVFCLGADADALSSALVARLPAGAQAVLLRGGAGALGDRLLSADERVQEARWGGAKRDFLEEPPADVYLFDGGALDAAGLLISLRDAGIDAPLWGGPAMARTQLAQIANSAVEGACHALTAPLLDDPSIQNTFAAGYRELSGVTPGPWASLAYDAAVLLLDGLEHAIAIDGRPTRAGVVSALAETREPDKELVFEQGRRREAEVVFYCYGPGDTYPGRISPWQ